MGSNGRYRDETTRVVVTGMGVTTPVGESLDTFYDSLVAGRSGITRWKAMDPRTDSKIGGDMSHFEFDAYVNGQGDLYPAEFAQHARKTMRNTPMAGRLAAASAMQAWVDAGLHQHNPVAPERFAHVLGGHNLNLYYTVENVRAFEEEPEYIDPLFGVMIFDTDILAKVSEILNLRGTTYTVGNACASGNMALMGGLDLLRSGRADAAVVSASAVEVDPVLLQGWAMMGAVAARSFNDTPERASRPFDLRREGFVPSLGAGAVILETLAGARARGAPIYGELLGAASTSDASRQTKPVKDGQVRAIRGALRDARVDPERVNYINAHGTSTPIGDAVEVSSIKEVFGERAYDMPINATKSMVGHCLTASSMVEFVATVLQLQRGVLHPTINLDEPDPELDLDFVPNQPREHAIDIALSNSFGFGGLNSCVVVGHVDGERGR